MALGKVAIGIGDGGCDPSGLCAEFEGERCLSGGEGSLEGRFVTRVLSTGEGLDLRRLRSEGLQALRGRLEPPRPSRDRSRRGDPDLALKRP